MRGIEWALVALVHGCASFAAIGVALALGLDTGLAPVVGAIIGTATAAWLYHRRDATASPIGFRVLVGALMAVLWVVVGTVAHWRWQFMPLPELSLAIGAIGTFFFPLVLVGSFRKGFSRLESTSAPLKTPVVVAIGAAAVVIALGTVAWADVAVARRAVALRPFTLPGLVVSLPDWQVETQSTRYERGELRLASPDGHGRSITLRWESGDLPDGMFDDFVTRMFGDLGMKPDAKEPVTVAGHEGSRTFFVSGGKQVFVTTWRCPEDSRTWMLLTFLDEPKRRLLATHERIAGSVHCHTEGKRSPPDPLYARFTPPEGWSRIPTDVIEVGYLGPDEELLVVGTGSAGRHELVGETVPAKAVEVLLKSLLGLRSIDVPGPHRSTVKDRREHTRVVWSCSGKTGGAADESTTVHVELMSWYCPERDASFLVTYMTEGRHDPSTALDVLLRADCHD